MNCHETIQANHTTEFAECVPNRGFASDVITRSENMRGIEADTQSLWFTHTADNVRKVLEFVPQAWALASGRFERDPCFDFRKTGKHAINRFHNFFKSRFFTRAEVRTGMQHQEWEFQLIGANQFFRQRTDRICVKLPVRGCEIDEIVRMGENR